MESIETFLKALINSPHYSFGWVVFAILAILPAIVSANVIQHNLSKLLRGENTDSNTLKELFNNILVLLISVSVMAYAYYLYFWN